MDHQAAARRLQVDLDAGPHGVEHAFRRLARQHHPDAGGDPTTFLGLVEARDVLLRWYKRSAGQSEVVITSKWDRWTAGLQQRRRRLLVKLGKAEPRVE